MIAASSASSLAPATDAVCQRDGRAPGRGRLGVDHVGRVGQAGRRVHRGAGHLGAHEHVGAQVLDGLEAADGLAELLALLGVGDREVQRLGGVTDLQRRGEDGAVAEEHLVGSSRTGCARRQRGQLPQRRQRVERRGDPRRAGRVADGRQQAAGPAVPPAGKTSSGVERGQVLDQPRGPPPELQRRRRPWPAPPPRPATRPARAAARKVPTSGPGDERPPQLLEDDDGVGQGEAGAGRLGQRQREDAGLAQGGPVVRADDALVALAGAQALERQPPGQHGADALGQLALVLARPGSPSAPRLGQAEDALGHDVALHLRGAGGDGQRDRLVPVVQLLGVAERRAVGPVQRVGGQRGPVEHLHGQVAEGLRVLGERELEDRAADAGDPGLRRLRDVALGEGPQRVEGGHEVADAPRPRRRRRRAPRRVGDVVPARPAAACTRGARRRRPCPARRTA